MIKILMNEWLKFKKSNFIYLSIGAIVIAPILIIITVQFINYNLLGDGISFYEFLAVILRVNTSSVSILFYTYFSSELIMYEFKNDTFKSQLAIPILRTDFLFAKILVTTFSILLMTLLSFVLSVILAFAFGVRGINIFLIQKFFMAFLKSSFLILPIAYFSIALVLLFKNIFIPMVFNFIIFVVSISITKIDLFALLPWSAPSRILFVASVGNEINIPIINSYISIALLAIVSFYISYIRINKMEF